MEEAVQREHYLFGIIINNFKIKIVDQQSTGLFYYSALTHIAKTLLLYSGVYVI